MYRAQRLKSKWESYRQKDKAGFPTHLNMGRFSLKEFLDYNYNLYLQLCFFSMETPKTLGQWLVEKL